MPSSFCIDRLLPAGLGMMLLLATAALAAEPFAVASSAFKDGEVWPSALAPASIVGRFTRPTP